jgi:hypothetical protein
MIWIHSASSITKFPLVGLHFVMQEALVQRVQPVLRVPMAQTEQTVLAVGT